MQPKFYKRYVDDIFAVFNCVEERDAFYKELNNAHNNLQFTMETVDTSSNSLPFLDVEISITQSETFSTKVYRKPTNTNVLMHHQAVAPTSGKHQSLDAFSTERIDCRQRKNSTTVKWITSDESSEQTVTRSQPSMR